MSPLPSPNTGKYFADSVFADYTIYDVCFIYFLQSLSQELEECKCNLEEKEKKLVDLSGKMEDKQENVRIVERKSQALVSEL